MQERIQRAVDSLLARTPAVGQYVDFIRYVPQGQALPPGTTHTIKLASAQVTSNDATIAVAVKAPYAAIADVLLGVL